MPDNTNTDLAIKVSSLSKVYPLYNSPRDRLKEALHPMRKKYHHDFYALKDVSFEIKKGETVGIIGQNGSGKSTLLSIIAGILTPSAGEVKVFGKVSSLLELGTGFNPELSGIENIYFNGAIQGFSKKEMDEKLDEIISFAEISDFINQPVKIYSSGMYVRLAFAVAINIDPEVLIIDEALSVGDELFQRKCFSRIEFLRSKGITILFVSHSGSSIVELCDRAMLFDRGEKLATGIPKQIVSRYQKLLYAPSDKRETIREQILSVDKLSVESVSYTSPSHDKKELIEHLQDIQNDFDQNLTPSSTIVYESIGAYIKSPMILNNDGRQVNQLTYGKSYRFLYTVEFSKPSKKVHFSMLIKAVNGIELSGIGFPAFNEKPLTIKGYCKMSVEFLFICKLLPGMYYINAGCRGFIQEEERFLHRIVDAICFRVLPCENTNMHTGYFDFIEPIGYEISLD